MSLQAVNPFLPTYEYVPNGKPQLFGDRVYLYGTHDKCHSKKRVQTDYVCWSAPIEDLADWKYEGVIYNRMDGGKKYSFKKSGLTSPDVVLGADGKYYFYYAMGGFSRIGVAVCDTPCGNFEFLGMVHYEDGAPLGEKSETLVIDPTVLLDEDGKIYLCFGRAVTPGEQKEYGTELDKSGFSIVTLKEDMLTVSGEIKKVGKTIFNSANTDFAGHEIYRSPCLRKFGRKYFLTYTSVNRREVCYAVSSQPDRGFEYNGVLLDGADVAEGTSGPFLNYTGRISGSIVKLRYRYFVFYNRQTNRSGRSRQACAEELRLNGRKFMKAPLTSCGLNCRPLKGIGEYPAAIACHLYSKKGAREYPQKGRFGKGIHPYFSQVGKDRNHTPDMFIANVRHGATVGFRYFEFDGANQIIVTLKGKPKGRLIVSETPNGVPVAKLRLTPCKNWTDFYAPLKIGNGKRELYFYYEGTGKFEFKSFLLQQVTRGQKEE